MTTEAPAGREWCNLAGLSDDEQHLVQWFVARFRDYSPDAKRVVGKWLRKFDLGVMEHGPLRLDRTNPIAELEKEFMDVTAYLPMIELMIGDIGAQMAQMRRGASRCDDAALVARLREFRQSEVDG